MERKEITKPYSVITAKLSLSPRELDILSLLIMRVKESADATMISSGIFDPSAPVDIDMVDTKYVIEISELLKIFNVSYNTLTKPVLDRATNTIGPSALEKACMALQSQKIGYRDRNGSFGSMTILPIAEYDSLTGKLTLETTRSLVRLLLDYGIQNNNFGKTDAKLLFSLKGEYDKRILDMISRFKNERDFKIPLAEFCNIFCVDPANYSTFAVFRRTVIEKPLSRIIKESNGMWKATDKLGKGYHLKRGAKPNDLITFRMKYTPISDSNL